MSTTVWLIAEPAMVWLEVTAMSAPSAPATTALPVELAWVWTSVAVTTVRVPDEKTSPSWIWLLMTWLGGV